MAAKNITIIARATRLSEVGLAGAFGIFWGVYLFLLALLVRLGVNTMWFNARTLELIASWYPGLGFNATFRGALVGLVIGLLCGIICGWILAKLYNWCAKLQTH
ncbi:hypothetical protein D6825_00290 [Candidatus Woesearchaeota archaeon]|nr:MAG: hypothetical protein D6825_00290 [Candidatus Woesearchaeota archaeon]